jgi:hypothetical protein
MEQVGMRLREFSTPLSAAEIFKNKTIKSKRVLT